MNSQRSLYIWLPQGHVLRGLAETEVKIEYWEHGGRIAAQQKVWLQCCRGQFDRSALGDK
jgi:hypothetical protein